MRRALLAAGLALASPALAHPAIGVVEDSRGNVFFTDLAQVWKITPGGAITRAVAGVHTHELYLDADDNLYGEHIWYEGDATKKWGHRVWKLSKDGTLTDVIPAREGFLTNYSFVRDAAGNMYWAGDGEGDAGPRVTIRKRAPDGTVTTLVGKDGGFTNIRWLVASKAGVLYAIDLGSVRRVDPSGKVTLLAADIDDADKLNPMEWSRQHRLMGLWPDADGSVYVANVTGEQVKRIAKDGTVSVVARSRGSWAPSGVGVAANGDLLILESAGARARVRRLRKDGSNERLFEAPRR
jgi:hypothetical protein